MPNKIFMVRAFPCGEYDGAPSMAMVELLPFDMALLERVRKLLPPLSATGRFYAVEFWSNACTFIEKLTSEMRLKLGDEAVEDIEDGKVLQLNDGFSGDDVMPCRTECDQIVITTEGIFFRSAIKHTSVDVETDRLSWAELGMSVEP